MERRHFSLNHTEVRVEEREDGNPVLAGSAALFGVRTDLGSFEEEIEPGFFADALDNSDPRVLFNHAPDNLLARLSAGTARVWEDEDGLHYEADLDEDHVSRFVQRKIERKELTGNSFAFTVKEDGDEVRHRRDEGKKPLRVLKKGGCEELYDVGPVTYPAYQETEVSVNVRDRLAALEEEAREEETEDAPQVLSEGERESMRMELELEEAWG